MKRQTSFKSWLRRWDSGSFDFTEAAEKPFPQRPPAEKETESWRNTPVAKVEKREQKLFRNAYPILAGAFSCIMILFLLITVAALPPFGSAEAPAVNEISGKYIDDALTDTGAVNIVAGVILDYRAFDTLGESHVLYTAATAVFILLLSPFSKEESPLERRITEEDPVLKSTARITIPFILVFGIYVLLNGHLGPGGGFSGGAVLGAALILYSIAFGFETLEKILNLKTLRIVTLCALCFYSLAKCYSFFCGANGFETIFTQGIPGAILSAGLILPLNIAVGLVVACTMYGIWSVFQRGHI